MNGFNRLQVLFIDAISNICMQKQAHATSAPMCVVRGLGAAHSCEHLIENIQQR